MSIFTSRQFEWKLLWTGSCHVEYQAMINKFWHVIVGNGTQVWLCLSSHEPAVCTASATFLLFIPLIANQITWSGLLLSRIKSLVVTYIVGQANYRVYWRIALHLTTTPMTLLNNQEVHAGSWAYLFRLTKKGKQTRKQTETIIIHIFLCCYISFRFIMKGSIDLNLFWMKSFSSLQGNQRFRSAKGQQK
jgi:hypothetical protein